MSITAIPPGYGLARAIPGTERLRDSERATTPEVRTPPEAPAEVAVAAQDGHVPAEAPAGTDPALWQILTPQERAFFARARTMGPLTYGPGSAGDRTPMLAQGGRIDVRV